MTNQEINQLIDQNLQLKKANEDLVDHQKAYQNSLKAKIKEIKALGPWKQFWQSVQLIKDIFVTIEEGFRD